MRFLKECGESDTGQRGGGGDQGLVKGHISGRKTKTFQFKVKLTSQKAEHLFPHLLVGEIVLSYLCWFIARAINQKII